MDNEEISHQQSLVTDSFSTIERLESDMAAITREFESLDSSEVAAEKDQSRDAHSKNFVKSFASDSDPSNTQEESINSQSQNDD